MLRNCQTKARTRRRYYYLVHDDSWTSPSFSVSLFFYLFFTSSSSLSFFFSLYGQNVASEIYAQAMWLWRHSHFKNPTCVSCVIFITEIEKIRARVCKLFRIFMKLSCQPIVTTDLTEKVKIICLCAFLLCTILYKSYIFFPNNRNINTQHYCEIFPVL